MKKIKDYSDEDDYEVDDPDYPEVEGASEEEWTPEAGTEVNRHAARSSRPTPFPVMPLAAYRCLDDRSPILRLRRSRHSRDKGRP